MIYLTGDTHGDLERFKDRALKRLRREDTLIVCGDFGFLWDDSPAERRARAALEKKKYTILFVDGTHDSIPLIRTFPQEAYAGGRVRRIGKNLLYAERGTVLTLEGRRLFFLGGGASDDMDDRLAEGTWHEEELPDGEELAAAWEAFSAAGGVDAVITHQPSRRIRVFLEGEAPVTPLDRLLERIEGSGGFSLCFLMMRRPPSSTLFPYPALFRTVAPLED